MKHAAGVSEYLSLRIARDRRERRIDGDHPPVLAGNEHPL